MTPAKLPGRGALATLALAIVLAGCHDAPTDPLAVLLAEETRSALAADARLPALPRLVEAAGDVAGLEDAAERWARTWDLPAEEGRPLRERLHAEVAPVLAAGLVAEEVGQGLAALGETLAAAEALGPDGLTEDIAESLGVARRLHVRAVAALGAGRTAEALVDALGAADRLREVGPESVTRMLLARAESGLDAALDEPADPSVDLQRAQRLVRGARMALEEGDHVRAIQRAYYACQVLGIDIG